ncbi:MAG: methionyl-tRNA formyltransferase [Gammaproteobacteria bacterium]|nr:methionyl-tRNA formyltransferase [Gammaproteobacteria bacterium]
MNLKIIFAGTPQFAVPTLKALLESRHQVCAVYTQPDKPSGRGLKLTPTPVKQFALKNNLTVLEPETLREFVLQKQFKEFQADILVDVAYGVLVPKTILETPRFGCINLHPSLLPRWRGAAPIQRALLAGDSEIGVTIMQMDEGYDTGGILIQEKLAVSPFDTTKMLLQKTSELGAKLLLVALDEIEAGTLKAMPQNDAQSTYAKKIVKTEAKLNWRLSAIELDRMVRAFNPWPIAYTEINGEIIRVWQTLPIATEAEIKPGEIIQANADGIDVGTSSGILRILQLQFPGKKALPAKDILNAHHEVFTVGKNIS